MMGREKYRGGYLAGKKVSFYDSKAQRTRVGEVRLHQGGKLLVLTRGGEWINITVDDVKNVYDGGKDGSN